VRASAKNGKLPPNATVTLRARSKAAAEWSKPVPGLPRRQRARSNSAT
jgi:hypothetical protein